MSLKIRLVRAERNPPADKHNRNREREICFKRGKM